MKKKIMLGITSSIAAYKGAEIASGLVKKGYDVYVVMTQNATKLISPIVFETLTRNTVRVDMFEEEKHTEVNHIVLADECELFLIAPATYNIIGKVANGIADDLLSTVLAAADSRKIMYAPAMNVNMYNNPVLIENIKKLEELGSIFIEPDEGMLACGIYAKGRLKDVNSILSAVDAFFYEKTLKGKNILITAGATREYIDPIRFISNSSSGLMGVSLAKACRDLGANVTLILANSALSAGGVKIIRVDTVKDMYNAAIKEFEKSDLVFAAAAVSDYKPKTVSKTKIKKDAENLSIEFVPNTDILLEMGKLKKKQLLIGFAAESSDLAENAKAKLSKKNLDMIIANDLSTFSSEDAKVWLVTSNEVTELSRKPKKELAIEIMQKVISLLQINKK